VLIPRPWTAAADGLTIRVHLTPKGGRDAIEGILLKDGAAAELRMKVRAAPEDGKANQAAIDCLAKALGVAKSNVRLTSGGKSRHKIFHATGGSAALAAALESCLEQK